MILEVNSYRIVTNISMILDQTCRNILKYFKTAIIATFLKSLEQLAVKLIAKAYIPNDVNPSSS